MKSLHIDFAPPSFRRVVNRIYPVIWFIGCAGLLISICTGIVMVDQYQQHNSIQIEIRQTQAKLDGKDKRHVGRSNLAIPAQQAVAVNGAIAKLNLPWRDLLDAMEEATPASIALLSLEPDARSHSFKGLAEAKNGDAMIEYIDQLKRQSFFPSVVLMGHEINEKDPHKPVRFQFEVQWKDGSG